MKKAIALFVLTSIMFSQSYTLVMAYENQTDTSYTNSTSTTESSSNNTETEENSSSASSSSSESFSFSSSTSYSSVETNYFGGDHNDYDNKTKICHKKSDYTYVLIEVSKYELKSHKNHSHDLIPAPEEGCPQNHNIPTNEKPVITLVGQTPITITVGDSYTDQGATAQDHEDGNITSSIVATSTVNTSTVGIYTVTYDVKDSKGLAADTVTRTVKVVPLPVNACAVTDTLGDTTVEILGQSFGNEPSLSSIISSTGLTLSTSTQKQYQTWHTDLSSTTIKVTFVNGYNGAGNVFGYYFKGNTSTFVPLFKVGSGSNTTYPTISTPTPWQSYVFTVPAGDLAFAIHTSYENIGFRTSENSLNVDNGDYMVAYDVANSTNPFSKFILGFEDLPLNNSDKDYNDTVVKVEIVSCENVTTPAPTNQAPVLTLVGQTPITITVGDSYTDQGATAQDHEDGNITSSIVATSTVNVAVVGEYTVTYNVKDSQGLAATPVTRVVKVVPAVPTNRGKITFCLVLGDEQNAIATSSYNLPQGVFGMSLSTSTGVSTTTLNTKSWNTESFLPNTKLILPQNDSDCITYDNLPNGTYFYSELSVNGSSWTTPKYNDGDSQPINSVFDFSPYSNDSSSDGKVMLDDTRYERTVAVYNRYKSTPACYLPEITSSLTAIGVVGTAFSYNLTASSTPLVDFTVGTSTLPAGLLFATSTNEIKGTPTIAGTFSVSLNASTTCGFDNDTLVITITNPSNGGGGNPTGANIGVSKTVNKTNPNVGEEVTYTVTVSNSGPENATLVNAYDVLPTGLSFVSATSTLGSYSTTTSMWEIGSLLNGSSTALTLVAKVESGTEGKKITNIAVASSTQNDPNSSDNTGTVDITVNTPPCTTCGGGGGGGGSVPPANGPIVGSIPTAPNGPIVSNGPIVAPSIPTVLGTSTCFYLKDFLRKDFKNDPVEVNKLQVFLKDFEGFSTLSITGVYDTATIDAVNVFQMRYKDDVLTPWGHTGPTGYVYITTKKKVNEIYCKRAFPVTSLEKIEIDTHKSLVDMGKLSPTVPGEGHDVSVWQVRVSNTTTPTVSGSNGTATTVGKVVEGVKGSINNALTTLAGMSSTTREIASNVTDKIVSVGKKLSNLVMGALTWPLSLVSKEDINQCIENNFSMILNLALLVALILVSYLWYRQYKNNKKIEDINKEIDLK